MGGACAAVAAQALIDAGAGALVSWGTAGGLDPDLMAGTICLPSAVVGRDGIIFATDARWRGLLAEAVADRFRVVSGMLLSSTTLIDGRAAKAAAFRTTGAVAVDMESAAVAAEAALRTLPFVAVRVIVDSAGDALPAAVMAASSAGQVRLPRLMLGMLRSPRDALAVMRLARRFRAARRSLIAVARTGALAPLAFAASASTRIA
jgi:adenosylhomocysteine nucleosidase